jgi:hypothetical protein
MHGRVAVLPALVCGGEGVWCLADAMLVRALRYKCMTKVWFDLYHAGHEQAAAAERHVAE